MTREVKTIFLVALTLVVYATSIFFSTGGFIFPYPLNSLIFFLITLQFAFWNFKDRKSVLLIASAALYGVLANKVFWEIILSNDNLQSLIESHFIEIFDFLYAISIFFWGALIAFKQNDIKFSLLTLTGVFLFVLGYFNSWDNVLIIGLLLLSLSNLIRPEIKPFHLLWILLFVLEASKWISQTFH